jgi:predicted NAD/FAD-binding protein
MCTGLYRKAELTLGPLMISEPSASAMKIAIVGSGISGLTTNYLLGQNPNNEVCLFEHEDTLGMDSKSVTVPGNHRLGGSAAA